MDYTKVENWSFDNDMVILRDKDLHEIDEVNLDTLVEEWIDNRIKDNGDKGQKVNSIMPNGMM